MTCHKMDDVLNKLSELSAQTIQSMDDNIALMNNIINLHKTIGNSKDDQHRSPFNTVLNQADYYSNQIHLMNLRTNYFEAQVNILAAHTTFNSLIKNSDEGIHGGDDNNWRTTEATLENLYLEYHYHTIKFREALNASNQDVYGNLPATNVESEDEMSLRLKNKQSRALLLKPLKTSVKRNSKLSESPMTPSNTTEEETFNDTSITLQSPTTQKMARKNLYNVLESPENLTTTMSHKRSTSMPTTPTSQFVDCFDDFNNSTGDDASHERQKNVRHFISYDTGLNEYIQNVVPIICDNSSIIKESEMFGSYDTHNDQSNFSFESLALENETDQVLETKSTLKRSKSHDSIFQLQEEPEPLKGSSFWMVKLSQKIQPTVETFNVTAEKSLTSELPDAPSSSSPLHDNFFKNFNDFLAPQPFIFKKNVNSAKTSKQLLNAVVTNSYVKRLEKDPTPCPIPIPTRKPTTSATTTDSAFYHDHQLQPQRSVQALTAHNNYDDDHHHQDDHDHSKSQWTSFLSKLNPQNLIPPSSVVTSEIGKPMVETHGNVKRLQHTTDQINKGSYSTLTIGHNHSRGINYGTDKDLGLGDVLSSKVSHSALNDALNDCAFY